MTVLKKFLFLVLGFSSVLPGPALAVIKEDPYKACDIILAQPDQERVADALFEMCILDRLMNEGKWAEAKNFSDKLAKEKKFRNYPYLRGLIYRQAAINFETGNKSAVLKLLRQAMKEELGADMLNEINQRKRIHETEFKSGQFESEIDFKKRYKSLEQDIEQNFLKASLYRAKLFLLKQRNMECFCLSGMTAALIEIKEGPSSFLTEIKNTGLIAALKMKVSVPTCDDMPHLPVSSLYLLGAKALHRNDPDSARQFFNRILNHKNKSGYWEYLALLALADCDLSERKFASAYQNYKLVYEVSQT